MLDLLEYTVLQFPCCSACGVAYPSKLLILVERVVCGVLGFSGLQVPRLRQVFLAMDANGDGNVSLEDTADES